MIDLDTVESDAKSDWEFVRSHLPDSRMIFEFNRLARASDQRIELIEELKAANAKIERYEKIVDLAKRTLVNISESEPNVLELMDGAISNSELARLAVLKIRDLEDAKGEKE